MFSPTATNVEKNKDEGWAFWSPKRRQWFFGLIIVLPLVVLSLHAILAPLPSLAELPVLSFLISLFEGYIGPRAGSIFRNWVLAVIWFFGGLAFISQFLFPLKTLRSRFFAFFCVLVWYFGLHRDSYVIQDGVPEIRIKGNRFSGLAGVVLIDSSSAAVMDDGLKYTRTIGPNQDVSRLHPSIPSAQTSTYFLGQYEQVRRAIDLRRQIRSRQVRAVTRDGIEIHCQLFIDFEITRDAGQYQRNRPYTFANDAVYHAVYGEAVKKEEVPRAEAERTGQPVVQKPEEEYWWTDAVINEGAEELRNIIAQRTLDQLYASDDPDREPKIEVEQEILNRLEPRVQTKGAHLLGVTLGVMRAPADVVEQKVQTWFTEWKRRQTVTLAAGEAEARRQREMARALAQLEMIQSLTQAFENEGAEFSKDVVSLRMIQAMEQMMSARTQSAERPFGGSDDNTPFLREILSNFKLSPKEEAKR